MVIPSFSKASTEWWTRRSWKWPHMDPCLKQVFCPQSSLQRKKQMELLSMQNVIKQALGRVENQWGWSWKAQMMELQTFSFFFGVTAYTNRGTSVGNTLGFGHAKRSNQCKIRFWVEELKHSLTELVLEPGASNAHTSLPLSQDSMVNGDIWYNRDWKNFVTYPTESVDVSCFVATSQSSLITLSVSCNMLLVAQPQLLNCLLDHLISARVPHGFRAEKHNKESRGQLKACTM